MSNDFTDGARQMILTRRHIPDWDAAEKTLAAMNRSFEVYFSGLKAGDSMAWNKGGKEIIASVRDSATEGYSTFAGNWKRGKEVPDDLIEALQYLGRRTPWDPRETKEYRWNLKQRQTYSGDLIEGSVKVPRSIFHFLSSVEGKMKTVGSALRSLNTATRLAEQQQRTGDWEDLGKTLKDVNAKAKKAKRFLWAVPKKYKGKAKFSIGFVKAADDIHDLATQIVDKGAERAILEKIAVEALGKLPILGQFYVAAIKSFPAIVKGYQGAIHCQDMMAESAFRGRFKRPECRKDNIYY